MQEAPTEVAAAANSLIDEQRTTGIPSSKVEATKVPDTEFAIAISRFKALTKKVPPIDENDEDVVYCMGELKRFHTAMSNTREVATKEDLGLLRKGIMEGATETVEQLNSVVGFAFDGGEPSMNAGMSVPLLSVVLATLMALFRDEGVAQYVSQDALALLLKDTARCLLDPRLAVSATHASGLDESTSSQIVRGMNKLAVQATTGTPRHIALHALMMLQQQLTLHGTSSPAETALNARLSRIVTKLFGKVMKAEEARAQPFSSDDVDMESVLCSIEDMLVAVKKAQIREPSTCKDMAKSMLSSFMSSGGYSVSELKGKLDELGIDSQGSAIARLLNALAGRAESLENQRQGTATSSSTDTSPDVATLVSAVGSAAEGPKREEAIDALRSYRNVHGDTDLHAYLADVSATFRAYILEQLDPIASPPGKATAGPMAERLRNLRTKLNVAETPEQPETESTPSRIPSPKVASSVSNLRQRLAAAQENRSTNASASSALEPTRESKTGSVQAAALRARLEAVKNQTRRGNA